MPEKKTIERAKRDKREGKAPSTQAGEFVREEISHVRAGKHGARSAKQAIAIGLSKARRAGVELEAPKKGAASGRTRKKAQRDLTTGRTANTAKKKSSSRRPAPSPKRARAAKRALKREGTAAASPRALSRQARAAASRRRKRGATARRAQARADA